MRSSQKDTEPNRPVLCLNPKPWLLWLTLRFCSSSALGGVTVLYHKGPSRVNWLPHAQPPLKKFHPFWMCYLQRMGKMHLGPGSPYCGWGKDTAAAGGSIRVRTRTRPGDSGMMLLLRSSGETEEPLHRAGLRLGSQTCVATPGKGHLLVLMGCCQSRVHTPGTPERTFPTRPSSFPEKSMLW